MNGMEAPGDALCDQRALVSIDLGAESCRVSLLSWEGSTPQITLMHRFPNGPVRRQDGSLRWPLQQILDGVEHGLRLCAAAAPHGIRSIAVDGWAVDYVRIDSAGNPLEEPFCYRDERTMAAAESLHERISPERKRELTGIQLQRLNTVYQLHADHLQGLPTGERWLSLPEFLLFSLGASPVAEATNASHTDMLALDTGLWSPEIMAAAGVDASAMPSIVPPGSIVGTVSGPLANLPAFHSTVLIAPACHDTASAIAGLPATGNDWAYISSGTWSLVGTVLAHPIHEASAHADGFTNLIGIGGSICFHRNVNGMWLLKQCLDAWADEGAPWTLDDLLARAEASPAPRVLIHVDDPDLLEVGGMPGRIQAQLKVRGAETMDVTSANAPAVTSLILHSLAARYQEVLTGIARQTHKQFRRLFVVGGGSRNRMLQRLTQEATGLEVHLGSPESSTIGNFAVQLATLESGLEPTHPEFRTAVAVWASRLLETPILHPHVGQ